MLVFLLYLLPENLTGTFNETRIASGIVAGIIFIGAGSIIASKGDIRGITTAASLWVIAAIGLMVGLGNYIMPVAATIIAYLVLRLVKVEKKKAQ